MVNNINDLLKIFKEDFLKNHQNREYGLEEAKNNFVKYISANKPHFVSHKSIVIWKNEGHGVVEFHTIHGGNTQDLIIGINNFLKSISKEFNHAVTYYDNPVINQLAKHSIFPAHVKKVDRGIDNTYAMIFDLRGK